MKRLLLVTVSLLSSLLLISGVLAQAPKSDATSSSSSNDIKEFIDKVLPQIKSTPTQKGGPQRYAGVVQKVDGNTITVRGRVFDLSAANLQGYESISQIREGDSVQLIYKAQEGKLMASAIAKMATKTTRPATRPIPPVKTLPTKPVPPKPIPEKPVLETPVPPKPIPEKPVPVKPEAPTPTPVIPPEQTTK